MAKKNKTHKAVVKRFKTTKTGKVLHKGAGRNHKTAKKSAKRIRTLTADNEVEGKYRRSVLRRLGK
ncbi:50S ribosomal protein L35 [bacterium]|nr:50S ribosomal protein L35 [bacterium]